MGAIVSSDCPKGTNKQGWWNTYCYPNSGYVLKTNGRVISRGNTGENCNQQQSGSNCWAQWHSSPDVPAYCISGSVYQPTRSFQHIGQYACFDPNDTSCTNWGGCSDYTQTGMTSAGARLNPAAGVGGGATLLLVGAAIAHKRRRNGKRQSQAAGKIEMSAKSEVV